MIFAIQPFLILFTPSCKNVFISTWVYWPLIMLALHKLKHYSTMALYKLKYYSTMALYKLK